MLNLKKVAVTGGLSCGKSSVCHLFGELGAYVASADEMVHQLLSPETNVGQNVIQLIGSDIVIQNRIDRSKIAKKVFNQPELLKALEQILHPEVRDEIEKHYQKACQQGIATLFVVEIPLLFESSFGKYDYTVAVVANENICKERFIQKSGYPEDEYNRRMSQQLSPLEKAKRADFVIRNEGTLDQLRNAVIDVYSKINQ
jgi:dephospho-CoA kinase